MNNASLSYAFNWMNYPREKWPCIIREYLDNGVDSFVFTAPIIRQCLKEPELITYLHSLETEYGVRFVAMHGIYGTEDDLDIIDEKRRPSMIEDHIKSLQIAAEFGSKTYTVHPGAYYHVIEQFHVPLTTLRENTLKALDKIIPAAEKCGVVVAVENAYEPPNSPDEILYYVKHYESSPSIGVCYDTGHANILRPFEGREYAKYECYLPSSWWETGIIYEPNALTKLKPYVVTTHIHDNTGYGDYHSLPYDGNIEWDKLMPELTSCPRMLEYQTEICYDWGENWAGKLPAPKGGYSIRRQVEVFTKLFSIS